MKYMVVFVTCLAVTAAHLCMPSPPQRGSMQGLNKKGADDCMLVKMPCGGRAAGNSVTLKRGQNFTVTFQKNLDHWLTANPGYFDVSFGPEQKQLTGLARIADKGEPSLTLYSVNVTIPLNNDPGAYIIQTTYVTKNPDAPAVFYQCGDINLL